MNVHTPASSWYWIRTPRVRDQRSTAAKRGHLPGDTVHAGRGTEEPRRSWIASLRVGPSLSVPRHRFSEAEIELQDVLGCQAGCGEPASGDDRLTPRVLEQRRLGWAMRPATTKASAMRWPFSCRNGRTLVECTPDGSHLFQLAHPHLAATAAVAVAAAADRAAATATTAAAATAAATTTAGVGREDGRNHFAGVETCTSPRVVDAGNTVTDGQDIAGLDARLGCPDRGPAGIEILDLLGKLLVGHRIGIRGCQRASGGAVDDARKLFRLKAPGRHEQQHACNGGNGVSTKRRDNPNQSSFHNRSLSWDATVLEDFVR